MDNAKILILAALLSASCADKQQTYDASGTFEAVETIISAEANGVIRALNVEEGQLLHAGQTVGYIDSTQLYLKKRQLEAQIDAVLSKKPNIATQLAALREQLSQAMREQHRIASMVEADAATPKQLDDANAQVAIIKKQIAAQQSNLGISASSITREASPLEIQIAQLEDQLAKSRIVNPMDGTVLVKYAEVNETTAVGKPVYKIADLSTIILRAYITGPQFAQIGLNQQVTVLVDDADGAYREYPGTIAWISDKAEFTPKTIQTKDERENLVYAIKIKVKNDGLLKIGMYGEVRF
ncbi:MAG TPA: HlyD family efflux transporter periplasmic adaptor subunit [Parapedobacter sp.]|uniref:HlyD family secretion protein n=1 Tax=Parapedobacter sp. TaxID=1958893 RepID=UPI002BD2CEA5|nr:HlyD family efflux transporter periplasmic adaptor subunit [Parapedobacter sp.]HWK59178.1 HlyD family efflux transporter periplasmic adaptor subunit [Parapedobacter sp.]